MSAARLAVVLPALAVAGGAVVATAHGLFAVAVAAMVPVVIAWLYPLITDGLALVAYAATHQLDGAARRYAWAVVVLAALLSGLAQAVFLAGGSAVQVSPALGFGVGAWPAIAAAIVAHLVYLLLAPHTAHESQVESGETLVPGPEFNADDESPAEDEQPTTETVADLVERRVLTVVPPQAPQAHDLIAAGIGRKRLARELGVTEHEARRMIDEARQG